MHSANNNKTQKLASVYSTVQYVLVLRHTKKQRNDRVHKNICIFRLLSFHFVCIFSQIYSIFFQKRTFLKTFNMFRIFPLLHYSMRCFLNDPELYLNFAIIMIFLSDFSPRFENLVKYTQFRHVQSFMTGELTINRNNFCVITETSNIKAMTAIIIYCMQSFTRFERSKKGEISRNVSSV